MPLLNPGVVLNSPYLSDVFQIIQRHETMVNGRSTWTESNPINAYGTVCDASSNDLERVPEGDRAKRIKSFVTPMQVQPVGLQNKPDILVWPLSGNGAYSRWLVLAVGAYPSYGEGWYQVLAASQTPEDIPL